MCRCHTLAHVWLQFGRVCKDAETWVCHHGLLCFLLLLFTARCHTCDRGAVSDTSSSTSDFSGCSFLGGWTPFAAKKLKPADIFVVVYNSSREDHEDHSLLQEQRSLAAVMFLGEGLLLVVSSSPSQPWCSLQVSPSGSGTSKRNHQETLCLRRSMWLRLDPLRGSVFSF